MKIIETVYKNELTSFAAFSKALKKINDSIADLDKYKNSKYGQSFADKDKILNALEQQDVDYLKNLSLYFLATSGIYQRLVDYMSVLLTYDWYAYPVFDPVKFNADKVNETMNKALAFLDNIHFKTTLADITRTVVAEGCYYGYLCVNSDNSHAAFLELPSKYCRSRQNLNGMPIVEFNLQYFNKEIRNDELRQTILEFFPKEFKSNYNKFLNGNIPTDPVDRGNWFICDPEYCTKFSLNNSDIPIFAAVIPAILDLDKAKEIDMKKAMQKLTKIFIQKMPTTKEGELVFSLSESRDMHNAACSMLSDVESVDIFTTFADVDLVDLDDGEGNQSKDPLTKIERGVYNEAGVSQNLFATQGNLALEKSILNDESIMFLLLERYNNFFNRIVDLLFSDNETSVKLSFPHLSIYNLDKKQKLYKELATNGYSKILPAISAGISQTEFIALNKYENDLLKLNEKLIPVMSSNTMSSDAIKNADGRGKPQKDNDELSEKTIMNKESMS